MYRYLSAAIVWFPSNIHRTCFIHCMKYYRTQTIASGLFVFPLNIIHSLLGPPSSLAKHVNWQFRTHFSPQFNHTWRLNRKITSTWFVLFIFVFSIHSHCIRCWFWLITSHDAYQNIYWCSHMHCICIRIDWKQNKIRKKQHPYIVVSYKFTNAPVPNRQLWYL